MDAEITKEEFMKLSTEKIKEIVQKEDSPKVGVLIPDGTRKSATFFYNLNPSMNNFEEKLFNKVNQELMKIIKIIFSHGINTLFVPSFTHGNLQRTKKYVNSAVIDGIKYILKDKNWYEFYTKYNIRVKVYGNLNLIKEMGYDYLLEWIKEVEDYTSNNKTHKLFYGLACSNKFEIPRIIDMCVDFYTNEGRHPTIEEKIEMYYGELVDEVDFFIRPTILRDSDIQPPLISGNKTQMYFPISPFVSISEETFREIIYDLLYSRTITYGLDDYNPNEISEFEKEWLKNYYKMNKSSIIGIGKKIGNLWIPLPQVKLNNSNKKVK
jgi:undecaprenyl diphosphate synthase